MLRDNGHTLFTVVSSALCFAHSGHPTKCLLGEGMNEVMNSTSDEKEELESKDLYSRSLTLSKGKR